MEWFETKVGPQPRPFERLVYQQEIASTGTPHLQGYAEFWVQKTLRNAIREFGTRFHLEKRKGTRKQARDYCKKDDTRKPGTNWVELGEWPKVKDNLKNLVSDLNKPLEQLPSFAELEDRYPQQMLLRRNKIEDEYLIKKGVRNLVPNVNNCHIITGKSGAGKTYLANQWALAFAGGDKREVYRAAWPTGGRWWWFNYVGQKAVVLDEFRHNISYQQMLNLLDIYAMAVESKGRSFQMVSERVYITTIIDPKEWYKGVEDKSELQRRIRENCTIWDFTGDKDDYPNFPHTRRTGEFTFDPFDPFNVVNRI